VFVLGPAIEIAQRSTRNVVLRDALGPVQTARHPRARTSARQLSDTAAFPHVVVQMLRRPDKQYRPAEENARPARPGYDPAITTASQRLTAVLEPLLILAMVVLVGFIAFATILPMLEAADAF
jgi:type II secretory pathway component PulF